MIDGENYTKKLALAHSNQFKYDNLYYNGCSICPKNCNSYMLNILAVKLFILINYKKKIVKIVAPNYKELPKITWKNITQTLSNSYQKNQDSKI